METQSPPMPAAPAGHSLTVDPTRRPSELIDLAFLGPVLSGEEPFTSSLNFPGRLSLADLVPEGLVTIRRHTDDSRELVHARASRGSIRGCSDAWSTVVWISSATSASVEQIRGVVNQLGESALKQRGQPDGLAVNLWHWNPQHGSHRTQRDLQVTSWASSRVNYPEVVARSVDGLMALRSPKGKGQLLLWHGPPGTGKTNAAMALLDAWVDWCEGHVVADPERLFENPEYLLDVALAPPSARRRTRQKSRRPEPWKLLVAEDADEYLRSDARRRSGPALGRLLNLTDGILGRGLNLIVLLTTNDDVGRLHPAVVRPGRCLAAVEFKPFPPSEAARWLGPAGPTPALPMTLAELYGRRNGWYDGAGESAAPGAYL